MITLLRYELRRMRSLPDHWVVLGVVIGFAVLADLTALGKRTDAEWAVFHVVQRDLIVRWVGAAVVGALAFGPEFRYGTIRPTMLAFPRTGRLLAGKTLAVGLVSIAGALLTSAVSLALLLAVTNWNASLFADPRLWWSIGFGAVTVGLVAACAAGLAALSRGTGLPIVIMALWAGVAEPLVVSALGGGAALMPFLSMLQLSAYSGDALGMGAAGPVSAVIFPLCLATVLAAAGAALARRDVSTH